MVEIVPAISYSVVELTEMMNRGYEGYVVPIHLTADQMANILRCDAIDLTCSKIAVGSGPEGFALIARRGQRCRLGVLAVVPATRGQGLGRKLLSECIAEAFTRGEREMVLEVIESNAAAIELYKSAGFEVASRLLGYTNDKLEGESASLEEITFLEVAVAMHQEGHDIPWQVNGEAIVQLALPWKAWRCSTATACTSDLSRSIVALRGFSGGDGDLQRLLRGLAAAYPGKTWKISPTYPEKLHADVLSSLGFELEPISQLYMKLPLKSV